MKKTLTAIIIGVLCLSTFSRFLPVQNVVGSSPRNNIGVLSTGGTVLFHYDANAFTAYGLLGLMQFDDPAVNPPRVNPGPYPYEFSLNESLHVFLHIRHFLWSSADQPSNLTIFVDGQSALEASNRPYGWYPGGDGTQSIDLGVLSSGPHYITMKVTPDAGFYCINWWEIISGYFSVSINPTGGTIEVGKPEVFSSNVIGGDAPYTYQWCLNNVPVSGATNSTWTFTPSNAGSYTVNVEINDSTGALTSSSVIPLTVGTRIIIVPDDYPTIQAAINVAGIMDTVCVKDGVYPECLTLNRSVSLVGENVQNTVVCGDDQALVGIYVTSGGNIAIGDFTVTCFFYGVELVDSFNNSLSQNCIEGNDVGLRIINSTGSELRNNSMYGNSFFNFGVSPGTSTSNLGSQIFYGLSLASLTQDIDTSNTVNGKPIYYWTAKHNISVPNDAGYVTLLNCSNVTVSNLTLNDNEYGVFIANSDNCTLTNDTITAYRKTDFGDGVCLLDSDNTTVSDSYISHTEAVFVESSNSTLIANNVLPSHVNLDHAENVTIIGNHMSDDAEALFSPGLITLYYSPNVEIKNNQFRGAANDGLYFGDGSPNGVVEGNSIIDGAPFIDTGSGYLVFRNNTIDARASDSSSGFGITAGDGDIVDNNTIVGTGTAIMTSHTLVANNNISDNEEGIALNNNAIIRDNLIENNTVGLDFFAGSSGNLIVHNNLIANQIQVNIRHYPGETACNVLDKGYPDGGNFWSDYNGTDAYQGPYQNLTGSDNIGDTPYIIDANNTDHYPLMTQYVAVHDVAVTNSTSSKTVVGQGCDVNITVTVLNHGDFTETFNLTAYANTTATASQNVTLSSGNSINITLAWNTTSFAYGNYALSAYAWPVLGETDTADNNFTGGLMTVTIPGNINGDFKVNSTDLTLLQNAYGSKPGDKKWNLNADINGNNIVDLSDLVLMAIHYGQHYP